MTKAQIRFSAHTFITFDGAPPFLAQAAPVAPGGHVRKAERQLKPELLTFATAPPVSDCAPAANQAE